jgi:hypothetical protein
VIERNKSSVMHLLFRGWGEAGGETISGTELCKLVTLLGMPL